TVKAQLPDAQPQVQIAPTVLPWAPNNHFGGELANFVVSSRAYSADEIRKTQHAKPDFSLIHFADISVGWPWQVRQWTGMPLPQAPWTLPRSNAPFSKPIAKPEPKSEALQASRPNEWILGQWRLAEAPKVTADAATISQPGFNASSWYAATVPGTVLTTLIDRGVYPDPDYGLNNMAIPESLARQSYWYRTEFTAPSNLQGQRLTLTFKGINYAAEVWLNAKRIGDVKGAFIRGIYDVTNAIKVGQKNALAVHILPPPHPGIPHEESIKAGPGENGGNLALDGPTFVATEGWDWIPGIRDRNVGLWQDVVLSASGAVRIEDPHVITQLPLPATDHANIYIDVPLQNASNAEVRGTLTASFDDVTVRKDVALSPGESTVKLTPQEFKQLKVAHPRLWWPNGYGKQELYNLHLSFRANNAASDAKDVRFGIRHITYELSLFDDAGKLQRVDVDTTLGTLRGERLIDVRHEAIKKSPKGWAASLMPGALKSPAVHVLDDASLTPYLAIRVNGVRIAARGGNWGMDDSRKRVSREKLEPYFELHKQANLNIIRNWMGQDTEDVFYDLADEYGLLILNDFWASTQDFQVEPEDPQLFLANARDVISRYRNHPSIALWFGRNEGVPQPILNEGLANLVAELDGTRHFNGSSNRVNLQGSGPYNYRPPVQYFTQNAEGFSVEVGTPSLATLESIQAWIPPQDRWPLSDTLAYHDWHFGGNGDVKTFMETLDRQFGAAMSLEDFERKAQMMNYVTHRAMFEGFQAFLWTKNSGRLLWMTHSSWPSNHWQIYSSDYDTQASYYGVKKACEPIHAQMNLPDHQLAVINTTLDAKPRLKLRSRVYSLDNRVLLEREDDVDATANAVTNASKLDLAALADDVVLVKLELVDGAGTLLSQNFYWEGKDESSLRKLNDLPQGTLNATATQAQQGDEVTVKVVLENTGPAAVLNTKLTLLNAKGERILPAYYADNYISLLPGERREVAVVYPAKSATGQPAIGLRAWNLGSRTVQIARQ
ncbi:MAG TPA: glycoside hydrolase family 2 TIM barrel-domain containing protein, partial [Steroidobacteraceae bacterium]|nr:glycoside hydrolase family 2 TIM barrel-domain containing protein [Steroidobacteraceae bacterium]